MYKCSLCKSSCMYIHAHMQVLKRMLQSECSELKMVSDGLEAVTEFNKVKLHNIYIIHCIHIV
jgi:hypothetical protein